MSIDSELNKILPYLKNIVNEDGKQIIVINFPTNWVISEKVVNLYNNGSIAMSQDGNYHYFYGKEIETTKLSTIIGCIEFVININLEREEKTKLFKLYIDKLKNLFDKHDLIKLKQLQFEFTIPEDELKLTISEKPMSILDFHKQNQLDNEPTVESNDEEKESNDDVEEEDIDKQIIPQLNNNESPDDESDDSKNEKNG